MCPANHSAESDEVFAELSACMGEIATLCWNAVVFLATGVVVLPETQRRVGDALLGHFGADEETKIRYLLAHEAT